MAHFLQQKGFDARAIQGGLQAWMDADYPTESPHPHIEDDPEAQERLARSAA